MVSGNKQALREALCAKKTAYRHKFCSLEQIRSTSSIFPKLHKTHSESHKNAFLGEKSPQKIDDLKSRKWLVAAPLIRQYWPSAKCKLIWGVRYNPQNGNAVDG